MRAIILFAPRPCALFVFAFQSCCSLPCITKLMSINQHISVDLFYNVQNELKPPRPAPASYFLWNTTQIHTVQESPARQQESAHFIILRPSTYCVLTIWYSASSRYWMHISCFLHSTRYIEVYFFLLLIISVQLLPNKQTKQTIPHDPHNEK